LVLGSQRRADRRPDKDFTLTKIGGFDLLAAKNGHGFEQEGTEGTQIMVGPQQVVPVELVGAK
jgi:hypothetical protein